MSGSSVIKLTDRYSMESDRYCWHLHESVDGKDKDGNPKVSRRTTYHPNLEAICLCILDREAGRCGTIESLLSTLTRAKDELLRSIEVQREALINPAIRENNND